MTKEQVEKKVAELIKLQESIDNKVESNIKMVLDILDKFHYDHKGYKRKLYIKKVYETYSFLWYSDPNQKNEYDKETKNAVKVATETGVFDALIEHMLNVTIPGFIKECVTTHFRPDPVDQKKPNENKEESFDIDDFLTALFGNRTFGTDNI